MVRRWNYFGCILLGLSITSTYSTDTASQGQITISDEKTMKTLQVKNTSNATSTLPASPTVIQQGNNVFIKPKFIYGSPFTSYKQGYSNSNTDSISVVSKVSEGKTDLPRFPISLERPFRPAIIPDPPQLAPLILPKLPIQINIKSHFLLIPDQPVFVQRLCAPMVRCILPDRTSTNIFSGILEKLKAILPIPGKISRLSLPNEFNSRHDIAKILPTLCAQSIIAERVVPNIISDSKNINVIMSPIL